MAQEARLQKKQEFEDFLQDRTIGFRLAVEHHTIGIVKRAVYH